MSKLFPELNGKLVEHVLRDGIQIDEGNTEALQVSEALADLGIITLQEHVYVKCANRDDYDYRYKEVPDCEGRIYFSDAESAYYCRECGQPIDEIKKKEKYVEHEVTLNPQGIETYLLRVLQAFEQVELIQKISHAVVEVRLQSGVCLKVAIPEYADFQYLYTGLFFAEPTIYIFASTISEETRTILEEKQYIGLAEMLSEPPEVFVEKILDASTPIRGRMDFSEIESSFDEMLERHQDQQWQFFEQDFIPSFVQHITENPKFVQQYLDMLKRIRSTIFGKYYVPIGGSGVTDLRGIDKYEMMNQLFEGNVIGDAKCYVKSTLGYDDLTSVNAHIDTDPTIPDKAVVFVAGNEISSTAWDFAFRLRRQTDKWKVLIIPKYLLLEIVNALDASSLLDM